MRIDSIDIHGGMYCIPSVMHLYSIEGPPVWHPMPPRSITIEWGYMT